jgi:hypothetical protein
MPESGGTTAAAPVSDGAAMAVVSLTGAFSMGFGLGFDAEMASSLTVAGVG